MTIRTSLEAKIASLRSEIVILEAELASGGSWLEKEWTALEDWAKNLRYRVVGSPDAPAPEPTPNPTSAPTAQ